MRWWRKSIGSLRLIHIDVMHTASARQSSPTRFNRLIVTLLKGLSAKRERSSRPTTSANLRAFAASPSRTGLAEPQDGAPAYRAEAKSGDDRIRVWKRGSARKGSSVGSVL